MKYNQELKKHEGDKLKKYKRFETLSKKAEDKKQFAVAVNAEFRSGQMAGFFIDKKEVKHVGLKVFIMHFIKYLHPLSCSN